MLATFADFIDRSFCLTTIRGGRPTRTRSHLRLLSQPAVGGPLVLYGTYDARRLVTSPVVRMFSDAGGGGTYVETNNSLYLLRAESQGAYSGG
jgi:hypothetical protein